MHFRPLGKTGIRISAISFGCGPVPELLTGGDRARQAAVVRRAVERGVNWFDTAATYGGGASERALGAALRESGSPGDVHVATKVRVATDDPLPPRDQAHRSFAASLERLGLERVTLLQLHNAVTRRRGDAPTSVTTEDVLGPGGVLEAFRELRDDGLVRHLGFTGIGDDGALRELARSGELDTVQTPYNLLDRGAALASDDASQDDESLLSSCVAAGVGFLAIRVYAGGALAGRPPSAHTHRTPFFPLDLYRHDEAIVRRLEAARTDGSPSIRDAALRFVAGTEGVASAIIGFGEVEHVDEALASLEAGPLSSEELERLLAIVETSPP